MTSAHPVRRAARSPLVRVKGDLRTGCADCSALVRIPPERLPAILASADTATRAQVVSRLQQGLGNAYVQRLLSDGQALQRYPVGVGRNAGCEAVVRWLNRHSPHRPMWAKTRVRFNRTFRFAVNGTTPDFTITVTRATVTVTKRVDMPEWSPRNAAMAAAWANMYAALRAHEAEHEAIGDAWRDILQERLENLSLPISRRSREAAMAAANAAIAAVWTDWLAEHRAAQAAIDPYEAILNCP